MEQITQPLQFEYMQLVLMELLHGIRADQIEYVTREGTPIISSLLLISSDRSIDLLQLEVQVETPLVPLNDAMQPPMMWVQLLLQTEFLLFLILIKTTGVI